VISGGYNNDASGPSSIVGGGEFNDATADFATVIGGYSNTASGAASSVLGGYSNTAQGDYSVAMGRNAEALHSGSFVWAAGLPYTTFSSTGNNQFLINAPGGVGIDTESPYSALHVNGDITVNSTIQASNSLGVRIATDEGTVRFHVDDDGNVGIGGYPDYKLDVKGDRIQLKETGTDHWIAMRTDGNLIDFSFGGANLAFKSEVAGEHVLINPASTNYLGIGTWVPEERLHVNGKIYVNDMDGTAMGYPVRWYNDRLYYQSSSRKYKDDIRPLEEDFNKILDAEPKSFIDRAANERCIGFIAEEFADLGLDHLVIDRDGEPDGIRYELVSVYLLEMIKELKSENQELKKRIETIEARN
jgi:hypothetical protein